MPAIIVRTGWRIIERGSDWRFTKLIAGGAAYNAFGPEGPRRTARGYDLLVQAATGIAMRRTEADGGPQPIGIFAVDMASSILAGYAVMLALFKRERTGKGQKVTGSLLQTGLALQAPEAVRVAEIPEPPLDGSALRPAV